ncbi:hypothetical protein LTR56_003230 [Elasticomyces elasticus]|nr:hypothetical protein LTR22_017800 [Elasticomyces elasticus]KAK3656098.1 hypothetical protein LTR56_003230 [Elasticomyces elasticus]KAK4922347.1 hypothetical protein LTR49_010378 [Elasticomyces elasticus]KAK5763801.1 hypothetical protein LTS12_006135 [Elasticomyces elasticus]
MSTPMNVPTDMHSVAATKVFGTPELLEMVLLQIVTPQDRYGAHFGERMRAQRARMIDLLACQRVNKTFRSTIKDSPLLQRSLFCAAQTSGNVPRTALNPLIHKQSFQTKEGHCMSVWWDDKVTGIPGLVIWQIAEWSLEARERRPLFRNGKWQRCLLTTVPQEVKVFHVGAGRTIKEHRLGVGATFGDAVNDYTDWLKDEGSTDSSTS